MSGPVSVALAANAQLGEGPVWDAARHCLWFVDIKGKAIWRFDPAGGVAERRDAPDQIGWVLPTSDGRLLAGLKTGLCLFDPASGRFEALGRVPSEPEHNRLNDACTDRAGRVWFGTMDDDEGRPTGRYYRFDRGAITAAGPAGITIANGPAVCGEGRRIYFSDTAARRIMVADLDAQGLPGPARLLADIAVDFEAAHPDGPVVDSEGCVWVGLWNGWSVARYSPAGALLETVQLPVANVTKLAFGGSDLRTAYVTTARQGLDAEAAARQPDAGAVFSFRSEVAGLAPTLVEVS